MYKKKPLFLMLLLAFLFTLLSVDSKVYAERLSRATDAKIETKEVKADKEIIATASEKSPTLATEDSLIESDSLPSLDQGKEAFQESPSPVQAEEAANEKGSPDTRNQEVREEAPLADRISESQEALLESENDPKSPESSFPTDSDKSTTSDDGEKSSPLEVGQETTPLPVGGGSSGGGGGGSSVGGPSRSFPFASYTRPGFNIVKVSQDEQNPMKVAFKITNLKTDESHIVVTDEEGKVNGLTLAETFDLYISGGGSLNPRSDYYMDEKKTEPDLYGRPAGEPEAPKDPFNKFRKPVDPIDGEKPKINQNDEFKDKLESNQPLKYQDFHKADRVVFENKHESDKLTLTLTIQLTRSESRQETVISDYKFTYSNVDGGKFDKDVFIREVEDFISAKAELINKTVTDSNKKIDNCSYTIKLVDGDRPKYKVEELRTDTNLGYNLRTFYLQPGDLKLGNRGPWDVIQEVWMGDSEDQLTTKLKSTADQNKEALDAKIKSIEDELEKIEEQINELNKNQEKDYFVNVADRESSPLDKKIKYTVTVKKLIDTDRTDPRSLINEFGDLYFGGHNSITKLNLKASNYDKIMTFDNLAAAQKYINSLKLSHSSQTEIFPGNPDMFFITHDNLLVRVYPEIKVKVFEMSNVGGNPPTVVETFDNAFDAYEYIDKINKLPDEYDQLLVRRYELEKERQALKGGYALDLSSPPKGLEKALEEYDKNRDELLYKKWGYYLEEPSSVIRNPDYNGPYTLLIYEKTQDLLNLQINSSIGSSGSPLENWLLNQPLRKQVLDRANLGLSFTKKVFNTREELEQWFADNDMANLDSHLRTADGKVRKILIDASPMNQILSMKIENEKFDFRTVATDESGRAKTVEKSTETLIQDKISYDNFNIGSSYKFVGRLVHKKDGKEVETLTTFEHVTEKLTERSSSVLLNVTFDSSNFQAGDEFVLLYDIYENGKLVGKEDDVNNNDQTVSLKEEPKTRDIKVSKHWDLLGHEKPVDKIEVELYQDGKSTGKKLELNAGNNWSGQFKNLEIASKDRPSLEYQYSIKELGEVNGFIQFGDKQFDVTYSGNMKDGFVITNKEKPEKPPETPPSPKTRDIKVTKHWDLLGREKPVDKIEVELYRDGIATGQKLELNADNNWSGQFKDLEIASKEAPTVKYQYTIRELGEVNGFILFGDKQFEVIYSGNMKDGFTITNREKPEKPPETPPEEPPETPEEPPKIPEEPPVTPEVPPSIPNKPHTGSPKTYDPGIGLYLVASGLSFLGLYAAKKKKED